MTLDRKALLAAAKPRVRLANIQGFGEVGVRRLSIRAKSEWAAATMALPPERQSDSIALLLIAAVCSAEGEPLFTAADLPAVLEFDPEIAEALFREIKLFNGLGVDALEDATKN